MGEGSPPQFIGTSAIRLKNRHSTAPLDRGLVRVASAEDQWTEAVLQADRSRPPVFIIISESGEKLGIAKHAHLDAGFGVSGHRCNQRRREQPVDEVLLDSLAIKALYQGMRLRRYPERLKTGATAADNTAREQRGRPFRTGLSGNPAGRPPGSRNRATLAVEALSGRRGRSDYPEGCREGQGRGYDGVAAVSRAHPATA